MPCKMGTAVSGRVKSIGWGRNERNMISPVANELELVVLELNYCRLWTIYQSLLDSQLCAKADKGDVCEGQNPSPNRSLITK